MYRLYIGGLDAEVTEAEIRNVFQEHSLEVQDILIKNGYAFCDCADQATVDKAIDRLHGLLLLGMPIQVEPSMSKQRRSNRIQLRGFPSNKREDVERLCQGFGTIQKIEFQMISGVGSGDETATVQVAFESPDHATAALNGLANDANYPTLKVEIVNSRSRQTKRGSTTHPNARAAEFPLRMLVPADFVGAIIGRRGATIKQITLDTRARVDVHGRDNYMAATEKAITIFGTRESCSAAATKILDVMQDEAETNGKGDVVLKLLAHNNLCGRLIGKGGAVIRSIMADTETKVTISRQELFSLSTASLHDINSYNMDRVITIKGSVSDMCRAEQLISARLAASFESDMAAGGGAPPIGSNPFAHMNSHRPSSSPFSTSTHNNTPAEKVVLTIPNLAVGAIIGSKGAHIRNIIRLSGAQIKIAALDLAGAMGDSELEKSADRRVTIIGTPEAQWKAQYYLFDKIKTEGFCGNEEARLQAEIVVTKTLVGRIIGKGGTTVREIQRVSGALIRLADEEPDKDDVKVLILGQFFANQSAQRRIRALAQSSGFGFRNPSERSSPRD